MTHFPHPFHFDPSYGYTLEALLEVQPPSPPQDFCEFWRNRYQQTLQSRPEFVMKQTGRYAGFNVYDIRYQSTEAFEIVGWLLEPEHQEVTQCIVVGHGYGGREQPDYHFNIPHTAFLFPCFRGISRSCSNRVSNQPHLHVLHDIEDRSRYILGGCVDDVWVAVSVMQALYPQAAEKIGYMGISFGGGIGALAAPWDQRIKRVHLNVPTFGCQALRLTLPTIGSGAAVAEYARHCGHIPETLTYYDAAIAARFALQPAHIAVALFDPMVAPPGQFGIYNAWTGPKHLFVLEAGHYEYPTQEQQNQHLLWKLQAFYGDWSA